MAEEKLPTHLKFYQHHRPAMSPGNYRIDVTGSIAYPNKITGDNTTASLTRDFAVLGERFSLSPQGIRAVFPAPGSTGNYANVLPHIILDRNTLPWERHAWKGEIGHDELLENQIPWLALLLFDEDQIPEKKIVTLSQLRTATIGAGHFPDLPVESGEQGNDKCTVIDVPKALLSGILPTSADLRLLAHTRQGVDNKGKLIGEEHAVVFCNRLAEQGKRSTLHLVSLEGRYDADGFANPPDNDVFRLVSLKSWEFYTLEHFKVTTATLNTIKGTASQKEFDGLSTLLDREFSGTEKSFGEDAATAAGLDAIPQSYKQAFIKASIFKKTFDGLLKHLNKDLLTLRMPVNKNSEAEKYLAQGLVPLEHHFRNGDRSVSWYHGPFLPTKPNVNSNGSVTALKPQTADDLLRFDQGKGMFQVGYGAAWEIGRLLALANKDYSISLFHWKRLLTQNGHKTDQDTDLNHLPTFAHTQNHESAAKLWQKHLLPWLTQLITFQSVPGNYLLPHESLLPRESIRFFHIDKNWQTAALCGALSIAGDGSKAEITQQSDVSTLLNLSDSYTTGFLLRSDLVDGWPGLLIDGINTADKIIRPIKRHLSRNILLCLFKEEVKQVVFHQKGEVMHFGFMQDNEKFQKRKRNANTGKETGGPFDIDTALMTQMRVVKVEKLAKKMKVADKPARFAMNMIEGVPKVVFTIGS